MDNRPLILVYRQRFQGVDNPQSFLKEENQSWVILFILNHIYELRYLASV